MTGKPTEKAGSKFHALRAHDRSAICLLYGIYRVHYPIQFPASFKREISTGVGLNVVRASTHDFGGEYWIIALALTLRPIHAARTSTLSTRQWTSLTFCSPVSRARNVLLADFAKAHSPYSSLFVNDSAIIHAGLWNSRPWDHWWKVSGARRAPHSTWRIAKR